MIGFSNQTTKMYVETKNCLSSHLVVVYSEGVSVVVSLRFKLCLVINLIMAKPIRKPARGEIELWYIPYMDSKVVLF